MKGNPGTVVTVRQMGGTVGEDTWTLEDYPMLEVGQRYLLTASNKPDAAALTLPAGPLSVQPVSSAADAQAKAAAWRTAIEHQRYRTTSGRRSAKPAGWHPKPLPGVQDGEHSGVVGFGGSSDRATHWDLQHPLNLLVQGVPGAQ